ACAVLVLEPAAGAGELKTARKGTGGYDLSFQGRAAHAGIEPEAGASALRELAHQILYLESLSDADEGTTVTVGIASGGSARNVVPAEARARVDVRFYTAAEGARL